MKYFQKRINEDLDFINDLKNSNNNFKDLEKIKKNSKFLKEKNIEYYLEKNLENLYSNNLIKNNIENKIPSGTFLSTFSSPINEKLISDLEKKVNLNKQKYNKNTNLFDIFYNDLKSIDEYFNIYKFHHFNWMESYSEGDNKNNKIEEDNKKTLDSILNHFSENATNTINEITKNYIGEEKQIKFLEFLENTPEMSENFKHINYKDFFNEVINYSALRIDCITDEINLIEYNTIFFDDDVKKSYI